MGLHLLDRPHVACNLAALVVNFIFYNYSCFLGSLHVTKKQNKKGKNGGFMTVKSSLSLFVLESSLSELS